MKNAVGPNTAPSPVEEDKGIPELGRFEKTMYGIGSGGYQLSANSVSSLANPIFNIVLGLSPTLIGLVLMLSRIFDAIIDPIMGKISDDTRSRWGRRRPYIFLGSFLSAFAFIIIWRVDASWGHNTIFWYYLGAMLLFYLTATIQVVPYHTLGLEMTSDYNQRNVISGYKMCFSYIFILIIPWVFRAIQLDQFKDSMEGMRFFSYIIAGIIIIGGLLPALFVKERFYSLASTQKKLHFWTSVKLVFQNKSFVQLTIIIILAGVCLGIVEALGPYIVFYYMYEGDLKQGAEMQAIISNIFSIISLACIPAIIWLANRLGKLTVLQLVIILGVVGELLKFVLYNKEYPWLAPMVGLFLGPFSAGLWTLTNSMNADICDEDELKNGLRREGMFASVGNWFVKGAGAVSFLLSGIILDLTGFDISLGENQAPETLLWMRILYSFGPVIFLVVTIVIISRYPLTRERMVVIRKELEERRKSI